MCGIAGMVRVDGGMVSRSLLQAMCDRLIHRGPDEEGLYTDGMVGLGQRRLSIIDLAGGHQPLSNEDGTVWVTYNGEIYNFHEVRTALQRSGHRFTTDCDTEVIVHAYEEDGGECVRRFRGMFAFALWDGKRRRLLLARDRLGKKPLFYAWAGTQFIFASELQGLLVHPDLTVDLDLIALDDYLTYGYVPAPRTIFRGVYKLLPGHTLELDCSDGPGELRVSRYWSLNYGPKLDITKEEASAQLRAELREAVRMRLVADVPLGALLSGGVDSSLIVALMSEVSDRRVQTFSIGFEEQSHNELPYARAVAQRYDTDHHELIVRPDAVEVLPRLVRHYGEPYADWSAVATYYVSQLTRQHVKVALNGDGGDESFAGYERYMGHVLAQRITRIPPLLRSHLMAPILRAIRVNGPADKRLRQLENLIPLASCSPARRHVGWLTFFTGEQKSRLLTPEARAELRDHDAQRWMLDQFERAGEESTEFLDGPLATDVHTYLPNDLLVKMDIATMANSLETRSPFLDHRVMELAARLPSRLKVRGMTLKYLTKQLALEMLPAEAVNRRKMGFGLPIAAWLRTDLRPMLEDTVLSPDMAARGLLNPVGVRSIVDAHLGGTKDYAYQLWALLCLELWFREVMERRTEMMVARA